MAPSAQFQRALAAVKAMKLIGFNQAKAMAVLKKLLKVYENNWEYIEAENYRLLADSILDDQESGDPEGSETAATSSDAPESSLKRLRRCQEYSGHFPLAIEAVASGETALKRPKLVRSPEDPPSNLRGKMIEPMEAHCSHEGEGMYLSSHSKNGPTIDVPYLQKEKSGSLMMHERDKHQTNHTSGTLVCYKEPKIESDTEVFQDLSVNEVPSQLLDSYDRPIALLPPNGIPSRSAGICLKLHRSQERVMAQRRSHDQAEEGGESPVPDYVHPSIACLRGTHRAAHPDNTKILEPTSHLLHSRAWQITCPRMIEALRLVGLDAVRQLQYIRLDHHLLTSLVERWSPKTNTFHLPVGEMTVTLQDVGVLLGVRVDGDAFIGRIQVGEGRRWHSWPDCCDELIGQHPEPGVVYHDPADPAIFSTFNMGSARQRTCLPLRWLRWCFSRESYLDLDEATFLQHVRAYILFLIGTVLLPDTSSSEVHLQYLTLLEDFTEFARLSIGAAVLAYLYRELREATKPSKVYLGGSTHLLQVWSWEHLYVGRPTLYVRAPKDLRGKSLRFRWNEQYVREVRTSNVSVYRDEIDVMQNSQVIWDPYRVEVLAQLADICTDGMSVWRARVPIICWRRVEWHLPDRVMMQFGAIQRTDMEPMDVHFRRAEARGRSTDFDWAAEYRSYIQLWIRRHELVVEPDNTGVDVAKWHCHYMRWYKSWASLYLLRASLQSPLTHYARSPGERLLRHSFLYTEDVIKQHLGAETGSTLRRVIDEILEIHTTLRRSMQIFDDRYDSESYTATRGHSPGPAAGDEIVHSIYTDSGPSIQTRTVTQPFPAMTP